MPTLPRLTAAVAASLPLVLAGAVGFATSPSGADEPGKELHLTFDVGHLRKNRGNAELTVRRVTHNGGSLRTVSSHDGSGKAVGLPAYQASDPPLAMLTVRDQQGVDNLDPASVGFRFGADFRLNQSSQGSSADNGNNLLQRGLYSAAQQYKVQLDGNLPSCRIKGDQGVVSVRSTRAVKPHVWYRATCTRNRSAVVLRVTRLGDGTSWAYRTLGATGSLSSGSPSAPLSVGGKVSNAGDVLTQNSDQFNGRIDNAFLNVFD